jgi:hypothetical protein
MGSFSTQTDVNSLSAKEILNTEYIREFATVASGTVNVGTNQYPTTADINPPSKMYRNYVLIVNNKSGVTINQSTPQGKVVTANTPLPNTSIGTYISLKTISQGVSTNNGVAVDMTSEEPSPFIMGVTRILFTLSAAPTSGTIDWALIGY